MSHDTKQQIREFIETSFLFRDGREALADDQSLLGEGLIDSTGILELVSFLETDFGIVVEDQEIIPENLDSIALIAAYIDFKHAAQKTAVA